jgi:hypothetical protein
MFMCAKLRVRLKSEGCVVGPFRDNWNLSPVCALCVYISASLYCSGWGVCERLEYCAGARAAIGGGGAGGAHGHGGRCIGR